MNDKEVIKFINTLRNKYGVSVYKMAECMEMSLPNFRNKVKVGGFTMFQANSLMGKYGDLKK